MAFVRVASMNVGTVSGLTLLGESRVNICRRFVALSAPKTGMPLKVERNKGRVVMKRKENTKVDGPTQNELKLLKELQEFIASCDLPPSEVPTAAELTKHGRKDLANRVKRKGYKTVAQLLEKALIEENGENAESEDVPVLTSDSDERKVGGTDGLSLKESDVDSSNDVRVSNVGSLNGGASERLPLPDLFANREAAALTLNEGFIENSKQNVPSGDLKGEEQALDIQQHAVDHIDGDDNGEDLFETDNMEDGEEDGYAEEDEEGDGGMENTVRSDLNPQSPDEVSAIKSALLRSRVLQYFNSKTEKSLQGGGFKNNEPMQQDQSQIRLPYGESLATETVDTQMEMHRLKGLLNSRESELSEVARQLAEAKGMLALARAKATAELLHVKQLAVEQDVKLKLAEQSLSQMKQIQLEWWGEAGTVEVAGNFNGWQTTVALEPDFSSEIPKADGSRGLMMWGTQLCLYSGEYEIKFIIDGNWQVDHRREVVMRDSNQNNILRVE